MWSESHSGWTQPRACWKCTAIWKQIMMSDRVTKTCIYDLICILCMLLASCMIFIVIQYTYTYTVYYYVYSVHIIQCTHAGLCTHYIHMYTCYVLAPIAPCIANNHEINRNNTNHVSDSSVQCVIRTIQKS